MNKLTLLTIIGIIILLLFTSCQKEYIIPDSTQKNSQSFTNANKDDIVKSFDGKILNIEENYIEKETGASGTLYTLKTKDGFQEILVLDGNWEKGWIYERNQLLYNPVLQSYDCEAPFDNNCTRLFGGLIVIY